jgi:hypothetical protein
MTKDFKTTKIGWIRAMFFKLFYGDPVRVEGLRKNSKNLKMKVFTGWFIDNRLYYTKCEVFS